MTLAGFHSLNDAMFKLALGYKERGMAMAGSTEHDQFDDGKTPVMKRVGLDTHDDGLVHSHE